MQSVSSKHTKPEMKVRSAAHRLGYRFRVHPRDLPGKPDMVLPRWQVAVFVHGCFWHRHAKCAKATVPKSNVEFWLDKFDRNVRRDAANEAALKSIGWRVVVIWQCEVPDLPTAASIFEQRLRSAIYRDCRTAGQERHEGGFPRQL